MKADWLRDAARAGVFRPSVVFAVLCCLLAGGAVEAKEPESTLLVNDHKEIWRVSTAGDLELVFAGENKADTSDISRGTTAPVLSPDQRLIAFTRAGDLWVFDVASKRERRLTHVGMPYTKALASVDVFITKWSFDGRKILHVVSFGDTVDPEGRQPSKQKRPANYGSYILDLASGQSVAVKLPSERLLTWLPDESLLFEIKGRLLAWRAPGDSRPFAESVSGVMGQADLSRDGRRLAILVNPDLPKFTASQLLVIDLATEPKTGSPITPVGSFAEYQRPKLSPSGNRTAYIRRTSEQIDSSKRIRQIGQLVIDSTSHVTFSEGGESTWIDESAVALVHSSLSGDRKGVELVVWNVDAAKEVARHQIYRGKATRLPPTSGKANP